MKKQNWAKGIRLMALVTFIVLSYSWSFGQSEANNWYFGHLLGLDFSTDPPTVVAGVDVGGDAGNVMEGASSISSPAGELLFTVSGDAIYSADLIERGTIVGSRGDNTAQSTMIIPVPNVDDEYYISITPFGSTPCGSPVPSYIPVTVSGTTGNNIAIGAEQDITAGAGETGANVTQGQMVLPQTDGSGSLTGDFWLVHHERNTDRFFVSKVSSTGIALDHVETAGPVMAFNCGGSSSDGTAYFKANACFKQFAYSYSSSVYLFDFDTQTGGITFKNSVGPISEAYGLEFSPSGNNVFVSTGTIGEGPNEVYQIPVTGGMLGAAVKMGDLTGNLRGGCLQIAPDGRIYCASMNSWGGGDVKTDYLAVIEDPDGTPNFIPDFIDLETGQWAPANLAMGLPTFLTSLVTSLSTLKVNGVSLSDVAVCQGETVDLEVEISGSTKPGLSWVATGGNTGSATNTSTFPLTMTNAGTTNISVTVEDDCGRERTIDFDIEVVDYESVSGDVSCSVDGTTATVTGTGASTNNYSWYEGDPNSGGTLIGIGASIEVASGTDLWVEAAGAVENSITSSTAGAGGSTGGLTNLTIKQDGSALSGFSFIAFTNNFSFGGTDWTATLSNGGTVGSVMSGTFNNCNTNGSCNEQVDVVPSDWVNLPSGDYTITITTEGALLGLGPNVIENNELFTLNNNAQAFGVTVEKYGTASCLLASPITVSCCTQGTATINTPSKTSYCTGESMTLTATPQNATSPTYAWYLDGTQITGESGAILTIASMTAANAGDYTVSIASSSSCTGEGDQSSAQAITVNVQPNVSATDPAAVCSPNTVDITSTWSDANNSGGTVTYYDNSVGGTVTSDPTDVASGTYFVEVDNNGCTDNAQIDVTVNTTPDIELTVGGGTEEACEGTSINITDNYTGGGGATISYHTGSGGVGSATGNAITSTGTYYIQAANGTCTDEVSVDVTVNPIPSVIVGSGETICSGATTSVVALSSDESAATYDWSVVATDVSGDLGNQTNQSEIGAQTLTYSGSGTGATVQGTVVYSVVATLNGCQTATPETVTFTVDAPIGVPTISTPDGEQCVTGFQLSGNASNIGTSVWSTSSSTVSIDNPSNSVTNVTGFGDAVTFDATLTVTNGTCSATTSGSYTGVGESQPLVDLQVVGSESLCLNESVTLRASPISGGTSPTFEFFDAVGTVRAADADQEFVFTPTASGQYSIYVVMDASTSECLGSFDPFPQSETIEITVVDPPSPVSINGPATIETCNDNVDLTGSIPSAGTLTWRSSGEPVNTVTATGGDNENVNVGNLQSDATVTVTLINSTGNVCATEEATVSVTRLGNLTPPNAVSQIGMKYDSICVSETSYTFSDASGTLKNNETASWSSSDATINASGVVSGFSTGENKIILTIDNTQCSATDTVSLFVDQMPSAPVINEGTINTCTASEQLDADAPSPASAYGVWTVSGPGSPGVQSERDPGTSVTGLETGTTTATWTVYNGQCVGNSDDVTIEKFGEMTAAKIYVDGVEVTSSSLNLCIESTYEISGEQPNSGNSETGTWTVPAGSVIPMTSGNTVSQSGLTPTSAGSVDITWTIENNTCPESEITRTFIVHAAPLASIQTPTTTDTCEGVGFDLVADAFGATDSELWSLSPLTGGALSNTTGTNVTLDNVSPNQNVTVSLEVSNAGCGTKTATAGPFSVDQVVSPSVDIDRLLQDGVENQGTVFCVGAEATFETDVQNGGSATYAWKYDGSNLVNDQSSLSISSITSGSHTIEVVMTSGLRCVVSSTASDDVTVTAVDAPDPTIISGDETICSDHVMNINANVGSGIVQWYLDGVELTGENNSVLLIDQGGEYSISEDNGECPPKFSEDVVVITEVSKPTVDADASNDPNEEISVFLNEESVSLNGAVSSVTTDVSIQWAESSNNLNGLNDIATQNPTFFPLSGGEYTYVLTATNTSVTTGTCQSQDSVDVIVRIPLGCPTAFTPNGDGINELWTCEGIETYPDAILRVYNRWGQVLYERFSNIADSPFDGTYNGKELPIGTYYYVLDPVAGDNVEIEEGYFELIR